MRKEVIDAFRVLELETDAEEPEASKAYKRLAFKHHPDRNHGDTTATAKFQEIGAAWETVSRHYKNPRWSQGNDGPGRHYQYYEDDDDDSDYWEEDIDEEERMAFYEFLFRHTFMNHDFQRPRNGFRAQKQSTPHFYFRTGEQTFFRRNPSSTSSYADEEKNASRQKAENDEYEARMRSFEKELEAEERAKAQAKREKERQVEQHASSHLRTFEFVRSGDASNARALIEEHNLDINSPERAPKANKKGKAASLPTKFDTLLHLAAAKCDEQFVQYLVEKGADTAATGKDDLTPFHVAILNGNFPVVRFFLGRRSKMEGCHPSKAAPDGRTPLQLSIVSSSLPMIELLSKEATVHDVLKCWQQTPTGDVRAILETKKGFLPPQNGVNEPKLSKKAEKARKQAAAAEEKAKRLAEEQARAEENARRKQERAEKRKEEEVQKQVEEEERKRRQEEELIRLEEERRRQEEEERKRANEEARKRLEAEEREKRDRERKKAQEEKRKQEKERQQQRRQEAVVKAEQAKKVAEADGKKETQEASKKESKVRERAPQHAKATSTTEQNTPAPQQKSEKPSQVKAPSKRSKRFDEDPEAKRAEGLRRLQAQAEEIQRRRLAKEQSQAKPAEVKAPISKTPAPAVGTQLSAAEKNFTTSKAPISPPPRPVAPETKAPASAVPSAPLVLQPNAATAKPKPALDPETARKRAEQSARDKAQSKRRREELAKARAVAQAHAADTSNPLTPTSMPSSPIEYTQARPMEPMLIPATYIPPSPPMTPEDLQTCIIPDDLFPYEKPTYPVQSIPAENSHSNIRYTDHVDHGRGWRGHGRGRGRGRGFYRGYVRGTSNFN